MTVPSPSTDQPTFVRVEHLEVANGTANVAASAQLVNPSAAVWVGRIPMATDRSYPMPSADDVVFAVRERQQQSRMPRLLLLVSHDVIAERWRVSNITAEDSILWIQVRRRDGQSARAVLAPKCSFELVYDSAWEIDIRNHDPETHARTDEDWRVVLRLFIGPAPQLGRTTLTGIEGSYTTDDPVTVPVWGLLPSAAQAAAVFYGAYVAEEIDRPLTPTEAGEALIELGLADADDPKKVGSTWARRLTRTITEINKPWRPTDAMVARWLKRNRMIDVVHGQVRVAVAEEDTPLIHSDEQNAALRPFVGYETYELCIPDGPIWTMTRAGNK